MVRGEGVPGRVVTAPGENMAKAKANVAVPPALPTAPVAAPVAPVVVARKLALKPTDAAVGDTFTCHGVTFTCPINGQLKQGKKLNCGWPLIAEGTQWYIVPGLYLPDGAPEGTPPARAHVIVSRVPLVEGTMSNGAKDAPEWKAWPFTTCTVKGGDA